jgi:hypothetical protein
MRKLVIGFSKPKGFFKPFSWAIRLVEHTPYSHVYIRSRSEALGVDLIYQASGAQVNFMGLEMFKAHALILSEFEIDVEDDKYKEFMRWAIVNAGAPYSAKQPLGILLIKLFNLRKNPFANGGRAWVCSELVGVLLSSFFNIKIDNRDLETIGPRGIFDVCKQNLKQINVI